MAKTNAKPIIYIFTNNHFDPTWRRCWDRKLTFNGQQFVSYADLEAHYMLENLELARKDKSYKFEAEATIVIRTFLERHPERKQEILDLAAAGRFGVTGAGDNIIDSNMVHGESLVRNYVTGFLWVEDHLGLKTRLGVRNDGFGNSAQIPQVFRGCEVKWVTGIAYSPVRGKFFRGLDGSAVCVHTLPRVAHGGHYYKYPPCPACDGKGCRACQQRGYSAEKRSPLPGAIDTRHLKPYNAAFVCISSEEMLPDPGILQWAKELGKTYDVRFALEDEAEPYIADLLAQVDNPPASETHDSPEANPNNSGCLVTRIRTKQTCRRQEYALLAAEALSVMAALEGAAYPRKPLAKIWERLLFTQFHDAITATHVDAAYEEIQDYWKEIDGGTDKVRTRALETLARRKRNTITVINPFAETGTAIVTARVKSRDGRLTIKDAAGRNAPIVAVHPAGSGACDVSFVAAQAPGLGASVYTVAPGRNDPGRERELAKPVIENKRFKVEADEHGIVRITDKKLKTVIAQKDEYRVGELIVEHDEGSPWATISPDQSRRPLAEFTSFEKAVAAANRQELHFRFRSPHGVGYSSTQPRGWFTVTLIDGIDRVLFNTHIDWDEYNHRIRVAFPVPRRGRHVYGIPYGALERKPYKPSFFWSGANGDWPAINWAGIEARGLSVALLNKGIPSYKVEAGKTKGDVILLSVLRSPAIPTFLHEPDYYTMTAFDGMRDPGEHDFEYALAAYGETFEDSDVVRDAEHYNAGFVVADGEVRLPEMPQVKSANARLTSLKWTEKGRGVVLRLVEYRGRKGTVTVTLPNWVKSVAKTNLLERQDEVLDGSGGKVTFPVRAWEIATLKLSV